MLVGTRSLSSCDFHMDPEVFERVGDLDHHDLELDHYRELAISIATLRCAVSGLARKNGKKPLSYDRMPPVCFQRGESHSKSSI